MNKSDPYYEFFNQLALTLELAIPGVKVDVVYKHPEHEVQLFHGASNWKGSYRIFPPELTANTAYRTMMSNNIAAQMKEAYNYHLQSKPLGCQV